MNKGRSRLPKQSISHNARTQTIVMRLCFAVLTFYLLFQSLSSSTRAPPPPLLFLLLQPGSQVYPSKEVCCTPGVAFPDGCGPEPTDSAQPCWIVDTYWPARLCRESRTLCDPKASGQPSWPSKAACCSRGGNGAFPEGCSRAAPQTPCYVVDSYYPSRRCRLEKGAGVCNRGWGTWPSDEVCCLPGAAFAEGCSA